MPGHCDIEGNENADRLAKDGGRLDVGLYENVNTPLHSLQYLYLKHREWDHSKWNHIANGTI